MSLYVINRDNVISINRGDYLERSYKFTTGKFPKEEHLINIGENDIIFFGLMDPHQHFEHAIIKKEFTKEAFNEDGEFILILDSEDTLDLVPGTYYYSIKWLSSEGKITTLIPKTKFIIVD